MSNKIILDSKIKDFKKKINVSGDKSLSIRWILFSAIADGISKSTNLLMSQDIIAAIKSIRKFGIKIFYNNKICKIYGKGINGFKYKKNITIDAENSGTLGD